MSGNAVLALDNGLGLVPQMGYSSWNDCGSVVTEDHMKVAWFLTHRGGGRGLTHTTGFFRAMRMARLTFSFWCRCPTLPGGSNRSNGGDVATLTRCGACAGDRNLHGFEWAC
jgi:hypothetical protein